MRNCNNFKFKQKNELPYSICDDLFEDNILNRYSSDFAQHRMSDQPTSNVNPNVKNLCKFTLNQNLINSNNKEMDTPANNEINSIELDEKNKYVAEKCENQETDNVKFSFRKDEETLETKFSGEGIEILNDGVNQISKQINNIESTACPNSCSVTTSALCSSYQLTSPLENFSNIPEKVNLCSENQTSSKQSLQEAYLKEVHTPTIQQNQTVNQYHWNVVNPLYKNIAMKSNHLPPNVNLSASLTVTADLEKLIKKEDSSDIETDEDINNKSKDSPRLGESSSNLQMFYNNLIKNKKASLRNSRNNTMHKSNDNKRELLVNTFLEVFGDDSHIIEKLRNNSPTKHDDRFRKFREDYQKKNVKMNDVCVIQESPRDTLYYNSSKTKLVQDLYKNNFSTITQSSNDNITSDNLFSSYHSKHLSKQKQKSSASIKSCECEIKHLQFDEVQKSLTDVHNDMKMMLTNFLPTPNEEIAVELIKLRSLFEECLVYQKKAFMQNKKLQNDIQTMFKHIKGKKSNFALKYFLLPALGVVVYFTLAHFEIYTK